MTKNKKLRYAPISTVPPSSQTFETHDSKGEEEDRNHMVFKIVLLLVGGLV